METVICHIQRDQSNWLMTVLNHQNVIKMTIHRQFSRPACLLCVGNCLISPGKEAKRLLCVYSTWTRPFGTARHELKKIEDLQN